MSETLSTDKLQQRLEAMEQENQRLRTRLDEAEQTLIAIQEGAVDALVINAPEGQSVFTLEGAERPYRAMIEQMQEGAVTLAGPEGIIHYCNRAFAELLNRPMEAIVGGRIEQYIRESDRAAFQALMHEGRERSVHGELSLCTQDGQIAYVRAGLTPAAEGGQDTMCLIVTDLRERKEHEARILQLNGELEQRVAQRTAELQAANSELAGEIDERKQAEETLRREQAKLHAALASMTDAVFIADAQGRNIVEFNDAFVRYHRFVGREQCRTKLAEYAANLDMLLPDGTLAPQEMWPVQRAARGESATNAEYTLCRRDTGESWTGSYSFSPIRDSQGTIVGVVVTARDITDRRRAEISLRNSEERFRSLFANAAIGFSMTTPDGHYVDVNPAYCALTGYSREELHALKVSRLLHPDDYEANMELVVRLVAGVIPDAVCENRYIRKDGVVVWVRNSISLVRNSDHSPRWIISLLEDVTARRQAQEQLRAAKAAAEEASKAKDHFLAVLSHELRNPLNPVMVTASMLLDSPRFDADTREQFQVIYRNAELEARLIDDLLDVTRIARGKVELNRQPVVLQGAVRRALEVCMPEVNAKQLKLIVELDTEPHCVRGDVTRLQQVFWNLLRNAIKFTPTGGWLKIGSRSDDLGHAVVQVSDSGKGIEPSLLPLLFEPFEQGNREITRQFGGLGLGLTISKALVELHGGTITAQSEGKDRGATFTVRLPIDADRPTPSRTASAHAGSAAMARSMSRSLHILLVEDHADNARVMLRLLSSSGHHVRIAADVATALRLAEEHHFDVLLSDLGLPDGSGLDLLQALRARGLQLPGIALSGYGQQTDVQQSLQAGFAAHLTKPVSLATLKEAIANIAGGAGESM